MTPGVKTKICGITRRSDALLAAELGAAALGFVFWRNSPRYIEPGRARDIVLALPPDTAAVGVFVDPSETELREVADCVQLTAVQLHGSETPEFCQALPYRVIKSAPLRHEEDVEAALKLPKALTVLVDAADPVRKGGTGQTVDWHLAAAVARYRRTFLAGGLTPDNVGDAVRAVHPYAVDVSSGLEAEPGVKDPEQMAAFFRAVETIGAREQGTSHG